MGEGGTTRCIVRRETRLSAIFAIAAAERWQLVEESRGTRDAGASYSWKTAEGTGVTWLEEHTVGVRCVFVEGGADAAARLRALLPCHDRSELLESARGEDLPGSIDGLRALAVLESEAPSPELLSLMR